MIETLYRTLSAPLGVQLELTTNCSSKCSHCYNYWRQKDSSDVTMSMEELHRILNALERAKVFYITLTGGEPLLCPDLVVEAIRFCSIKGIDCSINTNLNLATESLIDRMKRAGNFNILTSVATHNQENHDLMMGKAGAYEKTMDGIELLKRHGIRFGVNMVLTQFNADEVYETGVFAYRNGARSFSATKASPPLGYDGFAEVRPSIEQVKKSLDDLLAVQRDTGISVDILECYPLCFFEDVEKYKRFARRNYSAGIHSGTIGADGQVRPCSHSNKTYGSILRDDLIEIYSRMTEWRTGELIPQTCLSCNELSNCSGGCRCEAEYDGAINAMDPFALGPKAVKPSRKKVPFQDVSETTIISTCPSVRFREESFGYILRSDKSTAIVDREAGILLQGLQTGCMSFGEIREATDASKRDLKLIIGLLYNKNMILLQEATSDLERS